MKENASVEKIEAMYDAFSTERLRWLIGKGDILVQRNELSEEKLYSLIEKTVEEEFIRSQILGVLRDGAKTTTEVSRTVHLDASIVHWNLLALTKWNQVEIVDQRVDEYLYALKEIHG